MSPPEPVSPGDAPLPGQPVDLPLPPRLAEVLGYPGAARFVAFYWTPSGDEVVYEDGRSAGTGAIWSILTYRRHPAVAPLLAPWNLGYSDAEAEHCLVLDRVAHRASVAPRAAATVFLRDQHLPLPELTAEQHAEAQRRLAEILRHRISVPPKEIKRRLEEQRHELWRMVSWLDQCPLPPEGPGHAR
jgi:hypothetical protein